jgi:hypothetical protein
MLYTLLMPVGLCTISSCVSCAGTPIYSDLPRSISMTGFADELFDKPWSIVTDPFTELQIE